MSEAQRLFATLKAAAQRRQAGATTTRAYEAKIEKVLRKMPASEVDELVGEKNAEFSHIAEAIMAWNVMLHAASIFRQEPEQRDAVLRTLASSLVVLGSLVKYAYALGIRRGKRQANGAVRKRR